MYRREGIGEELIAKCARLLGEALRGGEQLARAEIRDWLRRNGVAAEGMRLTYILMWAELDAIICSGARGGTSTSTPCWRSEPPAPKRKLPRKGLRN